MIQLTKTDGLWTVTLNNPDKANALTKAMLTELAEIAEGAADKDPAALILTGSGTVFSAGADLAEAKAGLATDPVWERLSGALANLDTFTIAALNGTLAGGAFGMALAGFLTITSALVPWFERKRARALSIQTMGFALGGFAGPVLVLGFDRFGWRASLVGAGAILTVAIFFASIIISRTRAETGEPVDGIPADRLNDEPRAEGVSDDHFTARRAMRTRSFWMISLGHGSALIVVSATIAHIALYLTEDRGYTAQRAALIAGLIPIFQLLGTALGGYLGDRVNKRLIVAVAMCAHAVGLLVMTWIGGPAAIGVFVVLHGLAWGARGPLMQAIRADYFGATYFAQIMGWSAIIVTLGTVAGPLLAGMLADATGDYQLGFTIIAFLALFGNVFWFLATPPKPLDGSGAATTEHPLAG